MAQTLIVKAGKMETNGSDGKAFGKSVVTDNFKGRPSALQAFFSK